MAGKWFQIFLTTMGRKYTHPHPTASVQPLELKPRATWTSGGKPLFSVASVTEIPTHRATGSHSTSGSRIYVANSLARIYTAVQATGLYASDRTYTRSLRRLARSKPRRSTSSYHRTVMMLISNHPLLLFWFRVGPFSKPSAPS